MPSVKRPVSFQGGYIYRIRSADSELPVIGRYEIRQGICCLHICSDPCYNRTVAPVASLRACMVIRCESDNAMYLEVGE